MAELWEDIFCSVFSYGLALLYHLFLALEVNCWPYRVSLGVNLKERTAWAYKIMTKQGGEILGVQSARNSMLAGTLLASSTLIIAFELIKEFYIVGQEKDISQTQFVTAVTCIAFLLLSFFFFSLSIRAANHVSFLVCSHPWKEADEVSIEDILPNETQETTLKDRVKIVRKTIRSLTIYFSMGMRCMYLAGPTGLWFLGPWWLFTSMICVIGFVACLDHGIL
mmetsp:Transcript_29720/g.50796  ORF Transcript_29720/g.50796 Transcript_29720/m.50796 type:complete len:223 (-) Transcript_29720:33-701(-)